MLSKSGYTEHNLDHFILELRLKSLFSLSKGGKSTTQVGISFDEERVAIAIANHDTNPPTIKKILTLPSEKTLKATLQKAIKKARVTDAEVVFALKVHETKFHKIQKPNIPAEERENSLLFLMKDRLSQTVDNSLVACVDYPEGSRHDDQLMVFEASKPRIAALVDAADSADIKLSAIDVAELLYGDLIFSEEDMHKGVGFLIEHDTGVHLLLYRDHSLYLIRRLQDISDLVSCLPLTGNENAADSLLLEVQRTLDYYDSLMGQPMPAMLYMIPSMIDLSPLAEHLDASLTPSVTLLDINRLFDLPKALDYATQHDAVVAVAASLRRVHS